MEVTERKVLQSLDLIKREGGPGNVEATLGYAGQQPVQFVISSVFLWTAGPHEAVMDVRLREPRKSICLRQRQAAQDVCQGDAGRRVLIRARRYRQPDYEPGFSYPNPVIVKGPDIVESRLFAEQIKKEMAKIPYLRDLQYGQPQDYPTVDIKIDRELAGQFGLTPEQVGNSLRAGNFIQPLHSGEFLDGPQNRRFLPGAGGSAAGSDRVDRGCAELPRP